MKKHLHKLILFSATACLSACTAQEPLTDYVDPRIGTAHSRWFFFTPAAVPFGMAKLAPTTDGHLGNPNGWEAVGYDSRHTSIEGFANFHEFQVGGVVVAKAHNLGEHGKDAAAHAELEAMRRACRKLKQNRLWGLDLYVTLEPCTMCAAALSMMRIKRLVYGAANPKGGAVENGVKFFESAACNHRPEIAAGVLADECGALLTAFFQEKRKKDGTGAKKCCNLSGKM